MTEEAFNAPSSEALAAAKARRDYLVVLFAVWFQGCLTFRAVEAILGGLGGLFVGEPPLASPLTGALVWLKTTLPDGFSGLLMIVWTLGLLWLHRPHRRQDERPRLSFSLALPLGLHLGLTCLLVLVMIALGLPTLEMIGRL